MKIRRVMAIVVVTVMLAGSLVLAPLDAAIELREGEPQRVGQGRGHGRNLMHGSED